MEIDMLRLRINRHAMVDALMLAVLYVIANVVVQITALARLFRLLWLRERLRLLVSQKRI
jgi:hypothetical protein